MDILRLMVVWQEHRTKCSGDKYKLPEAFHFSMLVISIWPVEQKHFRNVFIHTWTIAQNKTGQQVLK